MDVSGWRDQQLEPEAMAEAESAPPDPALEAFRRSLEGLL